MKPRETEDNILIAIDEVNEVEDDEKEHKLQDDLHK
jgi:hypothetical protein